MVVNVTGDESNYISEEDRVYWYLFSNMTIRNRHTTSALKLRVHQISVEQEKNSFTFSR